MKNNYQKPQTQTIAWPQATKNPTNYEENYLHNTTMVKIIKHMHHHNVISNHAWPRESHVQEYLLGIIKIMEANHRDSVA